MIIYFLYLSLTPLLFLIIFFSKFFNKKIFIRLKNEKKIFKSLLENIDYTKKILIFHASAGEFQQLKPILKTVDVINIILFNLLCLQQFMSKKKQVNYLMLAVIILLIFYSHLIFFSKN